MPREDAGTLFGDRFQLGDLLGVGATASVYEAREATGGARVAVKVLHPHLSADDRARGAFLREARATQQVQHPNVAAVRATGLHEAGGVTLAWIALELVAGGSLADRVTVAGPMGPFEAAAVLDGVLAALEAAHAVGLVHRDVSPGNVLLARPAGAGPVQSVDVRLTDFGLADETGRVARGCDVLRIDGAEQIGGPGGTGGVGVDPGAGVIGSVHYMSPEQAQGKPARAAGDLYQVGALGYFLLTGQPPYPRRTSADVLAAHVSAPPPVPSALVAAAGPLDRVITHAMAKVPVRRFRDAAEFRAALADALAAAPTPVPRPAQGSADEPGPAPMVLGAGGAGPDASAPTDPGGRTRVLTPGSERYLGYLEPAGRTGPGGSAGPVGPAAGPTGRPATSPSSIVAGLAVAAVVVATVWGMLAATADPGPVASASPSPSTTVGATPTVTATVEPTDRLSSEPTDPPEAVAEAVTVAVPVLDGTLADAANALGQVGLALGTVTRVWSPRAADLVMRQRPAARDQVQVGSSVDLTVTAGLNQIPVVAGLSAAAAADALRSAGFVTEDPGESADATTRVRGTTPAAGTAQPVGSTVTLLIAAAASPTPTQERTPTSSAAPPSDGEES